MTLKAYKSQYANTHFGQICNSDVIYWFRSTMSIAYSANIDVSSGEKSYINDFMIVDTDDIKNKDICIRPSKNKCWKPDTLDKTPFIKISFNKTTVVKLIRLYFPFECHVEVNVFVDKTACKHISRNVSRYTDIIFEEDVNTESISLHFNKERSTNLYITEVEVYDKIPEFPWREVPFIPFRNREIRNNALYPIMRCLYLIDKYVTLWSSKYFWLTKIAYKCGKMQ